MTVESPSFTTKKIDLSWALKKTRLIHLDVGCGSGQFTSKLAKENPADLVVGIEIDRESAGRCANRVSRNSNALLIESDATYVLQKLPSSSISYIHFYFPTPPKYNRNQNALTEQSTINQMQRVLVRGGVLRFATDLLDLHRSITDKLLATKLRASQWLPALSKLDSSCVVGTGLERQMNKEGQLVYYSQYTK